MVKRILTRESAGDSQGGGSPLVGGAARPMRASVLCWRAACLRRGGNPPAPACPRRRKRERGRTQFLAPQADSSRRLRIRKPWCASPPGRLRRYLLGCEFRDSVRAVVNRHASVQLLMYRYRHPRQGVAPARLQDLKYPVVQLHRVVLIYRAFMLHAENVVQIASSQSHKSSPFLRRRHAEAPVEFLHVLLFEKLSRFSRVPNAQQAKFLRQPALP